MVVCSSFSTTTTTSSTPVLTSSQAVSIPQDHQQPPPCQPDADVGFVPLRVDDDERTDAKMMKSAVESCATWQPGSLNGSVPISRHPRNSPDSRRVHRPDSSPYRVRTTDRSPLRQQTASRSVPLGMCPSSWQTQLGSSYDRNGLMSSADNDRMDTSDDMPLNLSTGVRSSVHQSTSVDNRRRIFTSGEQFNTT